MLEQRRVRWSRHPQHPSLDPGPPKYLDDLREGRWNASVRDLTRWLRQGRDNAFAGILSGDVLPEEMGDLREEVVLTKHRMEEMWTALVETLEIGCTFLKGVGAQKRSRWLGILHLQTSPEKNMSET